VLDGNCGQEKVVEGEEVGRLDVCGDSARLLFSRYLVKGSADSVKGFWKLREGDEYIFSVTEKGVG